ncbi:MAG: DoxX family membrane protein [Cyanobacteria bacterium P01_A01_bin.135]
MLPFLRPALDLLSSLYTAPTDLQSWVLLVLRVGIGVLFVLHGIPKLTHLQQWAKHLKMPLALCALSATSMVLGGGCLVLGLLTPLACVSILGSMVFALYLEIVARMPLVAPDPYLIPAGEYDGPAGKGEPPSQEKALIYVLVLLVLLALGPGRFSVDVWLLDLVR